MNRILSFTLRLLGFNRPKPKTRIGLYLRRSERVLSIVGLLYLGLLIYPQILFAHSVTVGDITLYSRSPLPPEAAQSAVQAAALIERSELAVAGRRERVFICDAPWVYRLFAPGSPGAFAISLPITDHVYIAAADLARDTAFRSAPDFNTRSLSSVMAHEITHGLIRHRLGLFRGVRLPDWVAEGYCDYVARESSFPESDGFRLIAAGQRHPSPSFRYFLYRQMVRHLMDDQHLSFAQVLARAGDAPGVEHETQIALQARNTK